MNSKSQQNRSGIGSAIREAFLEGLAEEVVAEKLETFAFLKEHAPSGNYVYWLRNDEPAPFLLSIIPFLGRILRVTHRKDYVIGLSDSGLVVIRIKNGLVRRGLGKSKVRTVESHSLEAIADVSAKMGTLTSSLRVELRSGEALKFKNMLVDAPFDFVAALEDLTGRTFLEA